MSLLAKMSTAAVLPEDRLDAMYHSYEGGGVKVSGPALLVRKDFADKVSLSAGYYADTVSSASIDVVTTASPYKEKRTEQNAGIDYLHRDTLMSLSMTKSEESDYLADTVALNMAHEFFGGMTTLSLGYSVGKDKLTSNTDSTFSDYVNRYQYRLGLTQVLTKDLLLSLDYEAITDEGYLNSPYRSARVLGVTVPEVYPRTRSSHAVSLRALRYLEPRASLRFDYRRFWDNWEIEANTLELTYARQLNSPWTAEVRYRYYTQGKASFYSDEFSQVQNYMARDKELSTFKSHAIGGKASYNLSRYPSIFDKASLSVSYDRVSFKYDDFTDVRNGELYSFDADVLQLLFSAWY
jgi:hypothetical protein